MICLVHVKFWAINVDMLIHDSVHHMQLHRNFLSNLNVGIDVYVRMGHKHEALVLCHT